MKFKCLMIAIALYALPLTVVRAGEPETILEFSGNTVSYASVKPDGGLMLQKAWDGYELVRRADGNCYRIDHSNLRIENVGLGQRAQFDEAVAPASCH